MVGCRHGHLVVDAGDLLETRNLSRAALMAGPSKQRYIKDHRIFQVDVRAQLKRKSCISWRADHVILAKTKDRKESQIFS